MKIRFAAGLVLSAILTAQVTAFAQVKDGTLENAESLLNVALAETKDTAISQARNGSQIFSALRMARDPALVKLFGKLRESKLPENKLYGMISQTILANDAKYVDIDMLLTTNDPAMVGSAIASLIDSKLISDEQLLKILTAAPDPAHKVMAAGELNQRKALKDRKPLLELLVNSKEMVRHYAAITMLSQKSDAENAEALKTLNDMASKHDLRTAPVQALMMVKTQKENITLAAPWVLTLATDEANDEGLRQTALSTLLTLNAPEGPKLFSEMAAQQKEIGQQIKLGLIALENADRLKPGHLDPLERSRSPLCKSIAAAAKKSAAGNDVTQDVVRLVREGHPIVMDWALAYSDRCDAERRMAIRYAIIGMATIVDDNRGRDYERAALAAQKMIEDTAPTARKTIEGLLKSENRSVVEAVLAGIVRSTTPKPAELVAPIWDSVSKSAATESAANYAALILAREGRKEPLAWLSGMVQGGKVQNIGFRALAGWQYATLTGQSEAMLQRLLNAQ